MNQFFTSCFTGNLKTFAQSYQLKKQIEICDENGIINNFYEEDNKGWNALMFCVYNNKKKRMNRNRYAMLEVLLEDNYLKPGFAEFINKQDKNGLSVLMMASTETNKYGLMAVELLLKYGAKKELKDKNKWTALLVAGSNGNIEIVKLLNAQ